MTIISELYLYLTKVIFMLKHSVKLRRYIYLVMWQRVVDRRAVLRLKNAGAYNRTCRNHGIPFKTIIVLYTTDNTTMAGIKYKEQ